MKITAVLPAFNAAKTVHKTYQAIPKNSVHEVILVDDASADTTVAVAREIPELIVIVHQHNRGYGGNQKTCYTEALRRGADVIIMIHPDFQYDPRYVPKIIEPIIEGKADLVLGSRFLSADPRHSGMVWWRYWGNRFLTLLQNRVLGTRLSEAHSGYRAYSSRLLRTIPYHTFSDNFVFDSEMLVAVARASITIAEVPIPTRYTSESSSISFRSSIKYGLGTLRTLF